ncbi:hypothetical protein LguiB_005537 [Lonicera macranthoides]
MGSSGDCYLPEDLLIDILSSLPVKSLLRCKCVCKDWYNLIQSPTLITKHFHHHNNLNRLLVHRCVYRRPDLHTDELVAPPKSVLALFPNELLSECAPLVHQVVDSPVGYRYFDVIGPVHGLFMVLCCRRFARFWNCLALWNPATKEFRVLPLPSFNHQPPDCMWSGTNFGFGWDPSTSNFKVVWLQFSIRTNAVVAAVYTLATDSWRQLDLTSIGVVSSVMGILSKRFFHDFTGRRICTYLNGAYYWLSRDSVDNSIKIVLFDMEREVFREIPPPPLNPEKCSSNSKNLELLLRNDSIALLISESSGTILVSIDVWLMGQEGCWTDHLVFRPLLEVYRPLAFWENGEALFFETRDMQLLLYNPKNSKTNNDVVVGNFGIKGYDLKVFNYKESLVPIICRGSNRTGTFSSLKYLAQKLAKICQFSFVFF